MLCRKPEKEKDGERPNHQYVEKEKTNVNKNKDIELQLQYLHLMCGKLDDQTSTCRREEERERAGQTVKPALRLVCTVPLPPVFFPFLYMHICAFLAPQVL